VLGTPELGIARGAGSQLDEVRAGVTFRRPRGPYCRIVKPVADRTLAGLLLLVCAPLILVVAFLIRLKLGPGVMYRQRRVGEGNRVFTMYKFRTMGPDRRVVQAQYRGPDRRITHKTEKDPRHTSLGRTLRKWSLDELPQLFNVAKGNMSLVGPRPELADLVVRHDLWGHPRHLVKPGITGLWQISPDRSRLLHECLEYDVSYVSDIKCSSDLRILLATPLVVLRGRGR
jgi:lipopolysaccharide/colanic/teichoic acid biosynthesis glycosyltransferase